MRDTSAYNLLAKQVRDAFQELGFLALTTPQEEAIPAILAGENVLLIAPTGSGKTEAALLPVLTKFIEERLKGGIFILYITPLRALNRDMLKRISFWSLRLGFSVEVRHGDTSAKDRRRQSIKPPNLLITTPETLQAILPGRRMQHHLKSVRWVIVDEVHELIQNRRGAQLTIALERLKEVIGRDFQRIGLSATVGSPEKVAKFLAGSGGEVKVVQVPIPKGVRYSIEYPKPKLEDFQLARRLFTSPEAASRIRRIKELVDSHRSTLIFVNSRINAEMLGSRLSLLDSSIGVHHGSLSREERVAMEDDFKNGRLKAVVCTSTLELGIDIGSVDLVLQYLSPRQVSSLIQRVGRSGHGLGKVSKGIILTAFPDDVAEAIAAIKEAREARLEPSRIHENSLDVLAHQLAGLTLDKGSVACREALKIVRQAYPYRGLSEEQLLKVASYLDRVGVIRLDGGALRKTGRTRRYYYENLSMIPDEKRYPIIDVTTDRCIGTLGDEFINTRARVGLSFICRGRVWRILQIAEEGYVYVMPIEDPTAAIPGWDGEILPVPYELAQEVGRIRGRIVDGLKEASLEEAVRKIAKELHVEEGTVWGVVEEVREQINRGAPVPTESLILIEAYANFLIIHGCFGEIVNRTLGYIFDAILTEQDLVRSWWADGYRILVQMPISVEGRELDEIALELLNIAPEEVEKWFNRALQARFPFSYYMKFIAERFGAIPRGISMGTSKLSELPLRFKGTPIYEETLREALLEKVDLAKVKEILTQIKSGSIKIATFLSKDRPTPIAQHILSRYLELPELIELERVTKDNVKRMKTALEAETVELLCIKCRHSEEVLVKELSEKLECFKCGSSLLAVNRYPGLNVKRILEKRLGGQPLNDGEVKALANARQTADLVLSYGKKAVIALLVKGVGPQTASKILAKMHYKEEDFYKDLLKAKLHYIKTRRFWNTFYG